MKTDKLGFGTSIVNGLFYLAGRLPLGWHYFWGRVFAWILGKVVHYREDVVTANIARSFPEKKYDEIKKIKDGFYTHFGELIAEMIWFAGNRKGRGRKRIHDSRIVTYVNPEVINELYRTRPGVMALTGHAGNWELNGGIFCENYAGPWAFDESKLCVVYKALSNKLWDKVVGRGRCAAMLDLDFDGYVESRNVLRYAVSHRREKYLYIFNTDQYPYRYATGYDVGTFLNQPTMAMTGGASLACKMGMGVVFMDWRRNGRGHYEITLVPICEDASASTPEEIMRKYYGLMEETVKADPSNYLWSHKRWK